MGKFADSITNEADWEKNWAPNDLADQWFVYVNGTISAASEALLNAPDPSKERSIYEDSARKVTSARGSAETLYNKPQQKDRVKAAVMTQLLQGYDHLADLIENHGMLYLRALECARVFRGDWAAPTDNAVPPAHAENCNPYKLKHFGVDKKAAWYLGPFEDKYKLVKAIEEKAISAGLEVPGSFIFRFNAPLGWDGENGARGTINTNCIRVDSVGALQHSHPMPEEGNDCVSHRRLICTAIVDAVEQTDLDRLVTIAKYLTLVGAGLREYRMPSQTLRLRLKAALLKPGTTLPECKFWSE